MHAVGHHIGLGPSRAERNDGLAYGFEQCPHWPLDGVVNAHRAMALGRSDVEFSLGARARRCA
eukprot:scaffold135587_cov32-Tisochrysis_lutea.AAC.3